MKKQLIIVGITLLLLFVLFSGCTNNNDNADKNTINLSWSGKWNTDWDGVETNMTLNQEADGTVTGTYSYSTITGTIQGTVNGYNLTGISTEQGNDYPIIFTMNPDGQSFTGKWYSGTTQRGIWNGIRSK